MPLTFRKNRYLTKSRRELVPTNSRRVYPSDTGYPLSMLQTQAFIACVNKGVYALVVEIAG